MPQFGSLVLIIFSIVCLLRAFLGAAHALLAYPQLLTYVCTFLSGVVASLVGSISLLVVLFYAATTAYDPDSPEQLQQQQPTSNHPTPSTLDRARRTLSRISEGSRLRKISNPQVLHRGPFSWLTNLRHRGNQQQQQQQHDNQTVEHPAVPGRSKQGISLGKKQQQGCEVLEDHVHLGREALLPPLFIVPPSALRPQPPTYSLPAYSGLIWTIPSSTWQRDQLPQDFPPSCEGPNAVSHRWQATLANGKLTLIPFYSPDNAAASLLPEKYVMPLVGCEVAVVHEPLAGKSVWWKRGPLELRARALPQPTAAAVRPNTQHAQQLLYGEPSFYFYAEQGAAKEQWFLALSAACEQLHVASPSLQEQPLQAQQHSAPQQHPVAAHSVANTSIASGNLHLGQGASITAIKPHSSSQSDPGGKAEAASLGDLQPDLLCDSHTATVSGEGSALEPGKGGAEAMVRPFKASVQLDAEQQQQQCQRSPATAGPACAGRVSCTLLEYQAFCAQVLASAKVSLPQALPQHVLEEMKEAAGADAQRSDSSEEMSAQLEEKEHGRGARKVGNEDGTQPSPEGEQQQQQPQRRRFGWLRAIFRRGGGGGAGQPGEKGSKQQERNKGEKEKNGVDNKAQQQESGAATLDLRASSRQLSVRKSPSSNKSAETGPGHGPPPLTSTQAATSAATLLSNSSRRSCDVGRLLIELKDSSDGSPPRSLQLTKHSASESHLGDAACAAGAAAAWEKGAGAAACPALQSPPPTSAGYSAASMPGVATTDCSNKGRGAGAPGGKAETLHASSEAGASSTLASAASMVSMVLGADEDALTSTSSLARDNLYNHEHQQQQPGLPASPFCTPHSTSGNMHGSSAASMPGAFSPDNLEGEAGSVENEQASEAAGRVDSGTPSMQHPAVDRQVSLVSPESTLPAADIAALALTGSHSSSGTAHTQGTQGADIPCRGRGAALSLPLSPLVPPVASRLHPGGEEKQTPLQAPPPPPKQQQQIQPLEQGCQGGQAEKGREVQQQGAQPKQEGQESIAAGFGAAVEGVHGLNMLLVRLGFELLRAQAFQDWFRRMIQKRLDELKRPPYLHSLKLESLNLGSATPLVTDVRAVAGMGNASQGGAFWPQLVMDVCYTGRISMTVSTKIELQKAPLFSNLQSALSALQQKGSEGGRTPGSPGLSPATSTSDILLLQESAMHKGEGSCRESEQEDGGGGHVLRSSSRRRRTSMDQGLLQAEEEEELAALAESKGVRGVPGGFFNFHGIKRAAANRAQHLTTNLTERLARMPVELLVDVTHVEGTLMLWIAPPPSDRLWYAFLTPPKINLSARPVLGGRVLRYGGLLNRVSAILRNKLLKAVHRQLVYPACGDIRLGIFAPAESSAKQAQQQEQQHEPPADQVQQKETEAAGLSAPQQPSSLYHSPADLPSSFSHPSSPPRPTPAMPRSVSSKLLTGFSDSTRHEHASLFEAGERIESPHSRFLHSNKSMANKHSIPSLPPLPPPSGRSSVSVGFKLNFRGLQPPQIQHTVVPSAPPEQRNASASAGSDSSLAAVAAPLSAANGTSAWGIRNPSSPGEELWKAQVHGGPGIIQALGKTVGGLGRGLHWVAHRLHHEHRPREQRAQLPPTQVPQAAASVSAPPSMRGSLDYSRLPLPVGPAQIVLPGGAAMAADSSDIRPSQPIIIPLPAGSLASMRTPSPPQSAPASSDAPSLSLGNGIEGTHDTQQQQPQQHLSLHTSSQQSTQDGNVERELGEGSMPQWSARFSEQMEPAHHCQIYGNSDGEDDGDEDAVVNGDANDKNGFNAGQALGSSREGEKVPVWCLDRLANQD